MFRKAFPGVDHPSVVDLSTAGLLAPKGEGQVEGNGKRTNNQVNQSDAYLSHPTTVTRRAAPPLDNLGRNPRILWAGPTPPSIFYLPPNGYVAPR